jgi:phosphoribosylaminoimidazole-succinocarboxamide synthase
LSVIKASGIAGAFLFPVKTRRKGAFPLTPSVLTDTASRGFTPAKQGKVRDIFDLGDQLLIVATDRLSAFDVVLPDGIPNKGKVLTQISAFWFEKMAGSVKNHIVTTDAGKFPEPFRSAPDVFGGRSMLVRKTRPLAVECIVRGYLSGSGWNDYKKTQSVCGIKLPAGLRESEKLPEPLFTPSTKAEIGVHDENISYDEVVKVVGEKVARTIRDLSLAIYTRGAEYAASKGIIIADTKFEFGLDADGSVIWIDEALTPDSSRFWPVSQYKPGGVQPSFDKQFVRDYLLSLHWNKKPPAPTLPEEVVKTTSRKYQEALELLTGHGVR